MRESFYGPDEAIKHPLLNPAEKHNQTLCNTHTQKETHWHANDWLYLPDGPSTSHSSLRALGPPIFRAGEERGAGTIQEPLIITQYKREKKPTGNTHSPKYTQITTALRFIHTHTHPHKLTKHTLHLTACERQIESPPFIIEAMRTHTLLDGWGDFFARARGEKNHSHNLRYLQSKRQTLSPQILHCTDFHLQIKVQETR